MTPEEFVDLVKTGDIARVASALEQDRDLAQTRLPSGETPIMAALYRRHHHVVSALLAAGAPVDVFAAAALGLISDLSAALRDRNSVNAVSYDGWTPLHLAAFFGQPLAAEQLLAAGANPAIVSGNSLRNTALHAATAGGHGDIALALIHHGAPVGTPDSGGHTPLHIAAENGLVQVVAALLAAGADPFAVDGEDQTPLSRAAAKNHGAVIDELNRLRS